MNKEWIRTEEIPNVKSFCWKNDQVSEGSLIIRNQRKSIRYDNVPYQWYESIKSNNSEELLKASIANWSEESQVKRHKNNTDFVQSEFGVNDDNMYAVTSRIFTLDYSYITTENVINPIILENKVDYMSYLMIYLYESHSYSKTEILSNLSDMNTSIVIDEVRERMNEINKSEKYSYINKIIDISESSNHNTLAEPKSIEYI